MLIEICAVFDRYERLVVFFFNDTATPEIYTLSLHDALPIYLSVAMLEISKKGVRQHIEAAQQLTMVVPELREEVDRKSTRLNSSHANISYAVFCLKKIIICCSTFLTTLYVVFLFQSAYLMLV